MPARRERRAQVHRGADTVRAPGPGSIEATAEEAEALRCCRQDPGRCYIERNSVTERKVDRYFVGLGLEDGFGDVL